MRANISRRPRTWVLRVVQATLAFTVLGIGVALIASFWLGKTTGPIWWLVFAMPQVSIALIAVLICWAPSSRPDGLGLNAAILNMFGMIFAFPTRLPLAIGALTILALILRPKAKPHLETSSFQAGPQGRTPSRSGGKSTGTPGGPRK